MPERRRIDAAAVERLQGGGETEIFFNRHGFFLDGIENFDFGKFEINLREEFWIW